MLPLGGNLYLKNCLSLFLAAFRLHLAIITIHNFLYVTSTMVGGGGGSGARWSLSGPTK